MPKGLFSPPDFDEAHETYGAMCAHGSLAAVLRRPVMEMRPYFSAHQPWVSLYTAEQALVNAGALYKRQRLRCPQFPEYGLALVQIDGPWSAPGLPIGAALARTHWVGSALLPDGAWVYDVNAGLWIPRADWESFIVPQLLDHHRRSTGWRVRAALEVMQ